jgi:hypothetical protein
MTDTLVNDGVHQASWNDGLTVQRTQIGAANWAVVVAGAGVALLVAGAFLPDIPGANGYRSAVSLLFPVRRLDTYSALPYVAIPALAVLAGVFATQRRARPVVAGLLLGIAVEAYGLAFPFLAYLMAVQPGGKALLWAVPSAGAAITLTGSALLYARAEDRRQAPRNQPTGLSLPLVVLSMAAVAALLAAMVLPSQPAGDGWKSLLGSSGPLRWFALEPFLVALGGTVAVIGSAGRARATIGGVLVGLGVAEAISFGSMVIWTGAVGAGSAHPGSYVGLAGAVGLLCAGVFALVSAGRLGQAASSPATDAGEADLTAAGANRESTRLIAATAELDARFARRVVRDVVKDDHRAVAPSFGVNLGTVLRHCVAARGRHTARNVLLIALTPLLIIGLAHLSTGSGIVLALIAFAIAWVAIFSEDWTARHRVAARGLTHGSYDPSYGTLELTSGANGRIGELEQAESTNVVVYSGFSPFVGSGINQARWSFAVNVAKGREGPDGLRATPQAFTVDELQTAVAAHLTGLRMDLNISDRLYVDGELVRDEPRIVPDRFRRPRTSLGPNELVDLASEGVGRRFRCVTVSGWAGEVVYTLFVSFTRTGASLFADATACLLLPPHEGHRRVDSIEPRPFITERLRSVARAGVATIRLPLDALATLGEARPAWTAWRRRVGGRRAIASNPRYDYGALAGVREVAQSNRYRRYFQFADRDMYGKILDQEIFDAVRIFLAEHDIDTSDFEERQLAVLNYGVLVTGGRLEADSLAVGAQAQSSVTAGLQRLANRGTPAGSTGGGR